MRVLCLLGAVFRLFIFLLALQQAVYAEDSTTTAEVPPDSESDDASATTDTDVATPAQNLQEALQEGVDTLTYVAATDVARHAIGR